VTFAWFIAFGLIPHIKRTHSQNATGLNADHVQNATDSMQATHVFSYHTDFRTQSVFSVITLGCTLIPSSRNARLQRCLADGEEGQRGGKKQTAF
jgi:hypothetical protein